MRRKDHPSILEDLLSRGFDQSKPIGRDDLGRFVKGVHVRCSQCEALVINGHACHENRCPNIPREEVEDEFFDALNEFEDSEEDE